jgi:hypothetical protein
MRDSEPAAGLDRRPVRRPMAPRRDHATLIQ